MSSGPLTLLIVDDSEADAALIVRAVERAGWCVVARRVETAGQMTQALSERHWDTIVCDYNLPKFSVREALRIANENNGDAPFLVVSGVIDEESAVEAMKAGARDCIKKTALTRLAPAIERELHESAKRRALNKRYLAFTKLGQSLSSATSPREAASIITGVADEVFGWDSCFLYLYAASQDQFYHAFDVDIIDGKRTELPPDDWGMDLTPMLKRVLRDGPQIILRREPRFNTEQLRPFGNKSRPSASLMIVPARNGSRVVGFLSIQSYTVSAYKEEDLGTLQALADFCGGALERIRLEKEILQISSREQRRIGQNLHDGLCQHLAGIAFRTQILADKLNEARSPEAADAEKICELVNDAVTQTRGIARGVFPVQLEQNGLISALQELAANSEKAFKICCRFECQQPLLISDNALAENLYYIAHEALMNAVRHGKAHNILISAGKRGESHFITVRDDGVGISNTSEQPKGMGLHIMRHRARMIGATIDIKSRPANGTQVKCTFKVLEP